MSHYDYQASRAAGVHGFPFYALIMAAMRGADTRNLALLQEVFPHTWAELEARYHAPGGLLAGEHVVDASPTDTEGGQQ